MTIKTVFVVLVLHLLAAFAFTILQVISRDSSYDSRQLELEPLMSVQSNTEFPLEETTTKRSNVSTTSLDVEDANKTTEWKFPIIRLNRWFEYYNTTQELKGKNSSFCAGLITDSIDKLGNVQGIWVACHDPDLPEYCYTFPSNPCYPFMNFKGVVSASLRTVNISLSLRGFALARFTWSNVRNSVRASLDTAKCFDFSRRKDPYSECDYIEVKDTENGAGWTNVQTGFTGYDDLALSSFSIQLIARFKEDVILIDWVKGTSERLCGTGICPTTPIGPTNSPSTAGTKMPITTAETTDADYTDDFENETTPKTIKSSSANSMAKMPKLFSMIILCIIAVFQDCCQ